MGSPTGAGVPLLVLIMLLRLEITSLLIKCHCLAGLSPVSLSQELCFSLSGLTPGRLQILVFFGQVNHQGDKTITVM